MASSPTNELGLRLLNPLSETISIVHFASFTDPNPKNNLYLCKHILCQASYSFLQGVQAKPRIRSGNTPSKKVDDRHGHNGRGIWRGLTGRRVGRISAWIAVNWLHHRASCHPRRRKASFYPLRPLRSLEAKLCRQH
jgi:hypothetical protein